MQGKIRRKSGFEVLLFLSRFNFLSTISLNPLCIQLTKFKPDYIPLLRCPKPEEGDRDGSFEYTDWNLRTLYITYLLTVSNKLKYPKELIYNLIVIDLYMICILTTHHSHAKIETINIDENLMNYSVSTLYYAYVYYYSFSTPKADGGA